MLANNQKGEYYNAMGFSRGREGVRKQSQSLLLHHHHRHQQPLTGLLAGRFSEMTAVKASHGGMLKTLRMLLRSRLPVLYLFLIGK